jgi:glucose/arabinose dehydrogenase
MTARTEKRSSPASTRRAIPAQRPERFAFDADGWLFFGIGETWAVPYTLTAADGSRVSGGPEEEASFACGPRVRGSRDGPLGFWNPFHLAFDGDARLYAVDNDPDSRPPCRLIHVVRGGDYGYRRWLGEKAPPFHA